MAKGWGNYQIWAVDTTDPQECVQDADLDPDTDSRLARNYADAMSLMSMIPQRERDAIQYRARLNLKWEEIATLLGMDIGRAHRTFKNGCRRVKFLSTVSQNPQEIAQAIKTLEPSHQRLLYRATKSTLTQIAKETGVSRETASNRAEKAISEMQTDFPEVANFLKAIIKLRSNYAQATKAQKGKA